MKQLASLVFVSAIMVACSTGGKRDIKVPSHARLKESSEIFFQQMRQFTFDGQRSGEGYFSADGTLMIFQSEREAENPFYQIYLRDLNSGKTTRLSPGYGKTTCAWIAPDKKSVIFSSTHQDPKVKEKQSAELDFRQSGQTRRYSWDYDENYEIFRSPINGGGPYINLTKSRGYDAESSMSPDGRLIVFASNRMAYSEKLEADLQKKLAQDPSYFLDIFVMNADGSNVRQLTTEPGYDGGPFFSPDGRRIVWRHFSADGKTAEIFTMNVDGTDKKQITRLNAMSWAPFYHPSGDYIIFTSSVLGYDNFELFIVDSEGQRAPIRVTTLDGFDGLPVFTPSGSQLTWNRKLSATDSQIMIAEWDDSAARRALGLPQTFPRLEQLSPELTENDAKGFIRFLASKEMRGRATGTHEESLAATTMADYFKALGLKPIQKNSSYIQKFPFSKEATLGPNNELIAVHDQQQTLELNTAWRPVSFSKQGGFSAAPVVFAGYGIRAPGDKDNKSYDSFAGLDIKDKWVMVFRYAPENVPVARRLYLQTYSRLEHKAILAKELGARGIIYVSGPNANNKDSLVPFRRLSGTDIGIAAISLSDDMADQFFKIHQKALKNVQTELDSEKPLSGFEFSKIKLAAKVDIKIQTGEGLNTLGLLRVPGAHKTLVIGAHGDHLGEGKTDSSLMTNRDLDRIHHGADDNASGVAAVLELAHYFSNYHQKNPGALKQNILFAVWSGEELGNLGSNYFLRKLKGLKLSAYINMDMIGRWELDPKTQSLKPLLIQGVGSSPYWRANMEKLKITQPIQLQDDPYLPTDAMSFYLAKVPVVSFFTGVHSDYHTPRDIEEKINYSGLLNIGQIVGRLATIVAGSNESPVYKDVPRSITMPRRGFRIFLGTIPDYSQDKVSGVPISGVVTGGPAERAGLKGGDVIVEFSTKKISNIHDYVFALETLRPNEPTKIVVLRKGKRETLSITPEAKE